MAIHVHFLSNRRADAAALPPQAIEDRFDRSCYRLFRLLADKHILEQDQICNMAMVNDLKKTRLLLNRLFTAQLVNFQVTFSVSAS